MKTILKRYISTWWLPVLVYVVFLGGFAITAVSQYELLEHVVSVLLCIAAVAFFGIIVASIWNLIQKRWTQGIVQALFVIGGAALAFVVFGFLMVASMFGPSEDGFADSLTIPEGIEISEPDEDPDSGRMQIGEAQKGSDELQAMVRNALAVPGSDVTEFTPEMPSLRLASKNHAKIFHSYIEASPDWHVFIEQGNRFASRRWSYGAEPRDTLYGYISEFNGDAGFQTRCLICLDRKQWSRYDVQHAQEGQKPVRPKMSQGNELHESRVMIECGDVWVEIFEQSGKPERRVTKATVAALEKEWAEFLKNPEAALAQAQARSRDLAKRLVGKDGQPIRLLTGMQPGIYGVVYALNPGESGSVYLKAFEVTKGTSLSEDRLKQASETRMTWSADPAERFGAKAGFTIYEGDWGKPYAARFEVWFKPDAGGAERKLAERIFKIEGWQR